MAARRRILFIPGFTRAAGDSDASDEIGYGRSIAGELRRGLEDLGWIVDLPRAAHALPATRLAYVHRTYAELVEAPLAGYDAIVLFHAFQHFPAEIRRILLDRGLRDVALLGFTHGSHLDATDEYRERVYPGMTMADLGNLICLDRVLVVSAFFRAVLVDAVGRLAPSLRDAFASRLVVTGLTCDFDAIDAAARRVERPRTPSILFNHAPSTAKRPEAAFVAIEPVLEHCRDAQLLVTRDYRLGDPGHTGLQRLRARFGERVQPLGTLPLEAYYEALWRTNLQVSTASHESFGVATLEAMYAANACLTPERQVYPELTGGEGLWHGEADLTACLIRYCENPELREALGARLRRRASAYSRQALASRVAAAIEEVRRSPC